MSQNNGQTPDAEPLTRDNVAQMVAQGIEDAMAPVREMFQSWNNSQQQQPAAAQQQGAPPQMALLEMVLPHILPAVMQKVMGGGGGQSIDQQLNGLAALLNTVNNSIVRPQADRDMSHVRAGVEWGVRLSTNAFRATGTFPDADKFVTDMPPIPSTDPTPTPATPQGPLQASTRPWRSEVGQWLDR